MIAFVVLAIVVAAAVIGYRRWNRKDDVPDWHTPTVPPADRTDPPGKADL